MLTTNANLHYLKYVGLGCTLLCTSPIFALPSTANSLSIDAVQQQEKVTGTIMDADGEPIIGASVVVEGTTNGTITDW